MGDGLFLNRRIHDDFFFLQILWMHVGTYSKDKVNSLLTDAFPKIPQIGRVTWKIPMELAHPTKILVIGILSLTLHHDFVAEIFKLFQQKQTNHQSNRFCWSTCIGVEMSKCILKSIPWNRIGEFFVRLSRITLLSKEGHRNFSKYPERVLRMFINGLGQAVC